MAPTSPSYAFATCCVGPQVGLRYRDADVFAVSWLKCSGFAVAFFPGGDASPRHRAQSVSVPANAVVPFSASQPYVAVWVWSVEPLRAGSSSLSTVRRQETKPSHTSKRGSDGPTSHNPLISSASLTLVIPKPPHNTPRDVDASVTSQLLEEKDQLTQFLRHIERAVDDAVLCQRLTVGSDTVPVKPGPCNVREEVCAVVTKTLPMMARSEVEISALIVSRETGLCAAMFVLLAVVFE
jgi:hypothetical protein